MGMVRLPVHFISQIITITMGKKVRGKKTTASINWKLILYFAVFVFLLLNIPSVFFLFTNFSREWVFALARLMFVVPVVVILTTSFASFLLSIKSFKEKKTIQFLVLFFVSIGIFLISLLPLALFIITFQN